MKTKTRIEKGLCSGCGVCSGACPVGALSMRTVWNGDLRVVKNEKRCRTGCSLCLNVCPFSQGVHDPRPVNAERFGSADGKFALHEDIGFYHRCFLGNRTDETLRRKSASGGMLTWTLEQLLERKLVTKAILVRKNADSRRNDLFEFFVADTKESIRSASGSVYHQVEISDMICEMLSHQSERYVVTGVPCLCQALRNVHRLAKNVPFVLGLACGMYQNTFYTEILSVMSGLKNPTQIKYRVKNNCGNPGNFNFQLFNEMEFGKKIPYDKTPYYLGKNGYFRIDACNFCRDVFAEAADACFMDAWLPEFRTEFRGTSLVVSRNHVLSELFKSGFESRGADIRSYDPEQVAQSQRGHIVRKRHDTPSRVSAMSSGDWVNRLVRARFRYNQHRSKFGWKIFGRTLGLTAFYLSTFDLQLNSIMMSWFLKMVNKVKRIFKWVPIAKGKKR